MTYYLLNLAASLTLTWLSLCHVAEYTATTMTLRGRLAYSFAFTIGLFASTGQLLFLGLQFNAHERITTMQPVDIAAALCIVLVFVYLVYRLTKHRKSRRRDASAPAPAPSNEQGKDGGGGTPRP